MRPLPQILTFDEGGVSGHANHKSAHAGTLHWLAQMQADSRATVPETWLLHTHGMARKYAGAIPTWACPGLCHLKPGDHHAAGLEVARAVAPEPSIAWDAMEQHASQWVWFRRLFVQFSMYPVVNWLRRVA